MFKIYFYLPTQTTKHLKKQIGQLTTEPEPPRETLTTDETFCRSATTGEQSPLQPLTHIFKVLHNKSHIEQRTEHEPARSTMMRAVLIVGHKLT